MSNTRRFAISGRPLTANSFRSDSSLTGRSTRWIPRRASPGFGVQPRNEPANDQVAINLLQTQTLLVPVALSESDLPALAEHLLRLSPDDRDLRFQGKVSETAIRGYAIQINLHRDVAYGVFQGTRLVAACHIGVYLEDGRTVGEVGVSVDVGLRGTGLGRRLVEAARHSAAEGGVRRLDFVFLRRNHGMLQLARALGAELSFEEGEWTARLELPDAPVMPLMTELRGTTAGIEVLATEGDASRTVMLVHGAGGDPWQFRRHFIPFLHARGHRVVALSLRHHGRSARTGPARVAQHAADVLDVIRDVGLPQTIIGHSMGALVVQHAVQEVRVHRVVLLAPIPHDGLSSNELVRALGALKTSAARTALVDGLAGYVPLAMRSRQQQIFVIGGMHDKVISPQAVQRVADFHGTRAIMLPAGHMLMNGRSWKKAASSAMGAVEHAEC
jgi:GNAT superfamily N-acetyltransferase